MGEENLEISFEEIQTVTVATIRGGVLVDAAASIRKALDAGVEAHKALDAALDTANANHQDGVTEYDRAVVAAALKFKDAEKDLLLALLDYTEVITGGVGDGTEVFNILLGMDGPEVDIKGLFPG